MARTREVLIEFAKAVLESDAFLMTDSQGICIDGWIEGLSSEQIAFLTKYRQEALDKKLGEADGDV